MNIIILALENWGKGARALSGNYAFQLELQTCFASVSRFGMEERRRLRPTFFFFFSFVRISNSENYRVPNLWTGLIKPYVELQVIERPNNKKKRIGVFFFFLFFSKLWLKIYLSDVKVTDATFQTQISPRFGGSK